MSIYAGVDIGGTKILCGAVGADGEVLAKTRVATPRGGTPEELCDVIARSVKQVGDGLDLDGVGVGVAAYVSADRSMAMFAPHLPFRRYPLEQVLEESLDLPVVIENDANAAIWAESRFGAAQGAEEIIGVTVGTGIGGAVIVGGHLRRGANGFGGEFGHLRVVPDGHPCPCGLRGCLEQYASGTALARFGRELLERHGASAGMLHDLAGGDPARVDGPLLSKAARAGDQQALEIFRQFGGWLGAGLASLSSALDPETIVVGGGLVEVSDLYLDAVRETYAATLTGAAYRRLAPILPARLGPDAGFLGAADLARTGG